MNVRPKGMPKPAKTKLLTPVVLPQRPPTWQDIMTPKESSMPLRRSTVTPSTRRRAKEKFLRGRRDLRLEREEARHERALHHADVDGLADVHDEAEDLRAGDVRGAGDVEAADAGAAPPAGC